MKNALYFVGSVVIIVGLLWFGFSGSLADGSTLGGYLAGCLWAFSLYIFIMVAAVSAIEISDELSDDSTQELPVKRVKSQRTGPSLGARQAIARVRMADEKQIRVVQFGNPINHSVKLTFDENGIREAN